MISTHQRGKFGVGSLPPGCLTKVRTEGGADGYTAKKAGADEATKEADNTKPHFLRAPEPVTQPGIRGNITLEADVNTDGVVTNVRTIRNTTGSVSLEQRNITELRRATFSPVVRHGRREAFVYEHRVEY